MTSVVVRNDKYSDVEIHEIGVLLSCWTWFSIYDGRRSGMVDSESSSEWQV